MLGSVVEGAPVDPTAATEGLRLWAPAPPPPPQPQPQPPQLRELVRKYWKGARAAAHYRQGPRLPPLLQRPSLGNPPDGCTATAAWWPLAASSVPLARLRCLAIDWHAPEPCLARTAVPIPPHHPAVYWRMPSYNFARVIMTFLVSWIYGTTYYKAGGRAGGAGLRLKIGVVLGGENNEGRRRAWHVPYAHG
jgi:hypothetical protein